MEKSPAEWSAWAKDTFACDVCRCAPSDFEGYGRGMGAVDAVSRGDCVVRIPLSRCLTVDTARSSPALAGVIERLPETLCESSAALIALLLLAERGAGADAQSHLQAYITLVPEEPESLLAWTEEELQDLQGSKWAMIAETTRAEIQEEFAEITEALGEATLERLKIDLDGYLWAQGLISSRAVQFYMGPEDPPFQVLTPLHDLFNHGEDVHLEDVETMRLEGDGDERYVAVYTAKDCAAGEQILTSFANASNGRLLCQAGFVLENNNFDSVELQLTLPAVAQALPVYRLLVEMCDVPQLKSGQAVSQDVLENFLFVQLPEEAPTSEPQSVMVHVRLTLQQPLGEELMLRFVRLATLPSQSLTPDVLERVLSGKIISDAHETRVLQVLRQSIQGMLAGYPRTLKEDEAEWQTIPVGPERLTTRKAKALIVVMQEKKIYQAALQALDKLLQGLTKS